MKPNIAVFVATPNDAEGILLVKRVTWLATYPNEKEGITREDIEAKLIEKEKNGKEKLVNRIANDPNTSIRVAKDGKNVVGFVETQRIESTGKIHALYINPLYHRQGIGTKLMNEILSWLGDVKQISLEVVAYNHEAISFYKKLGFVENGPTDCDAAKLPGGSVMRSIEMIRKL